VTLHRVDALANDQFWQGPVLREKNVLKIGRVVVPKALDASGAEGDPRPEGAVHVAIDEDEIPFPRECRDGCHAGKITGAEYLTVLLTEEKGKILLKFAVIDARTVGETSTGGTASPFAESFFASLDNTGVSTEPEIVVAAHHEHAFAVEPDMRALLTFGMVIPWLVTKAGSRRLIFATALLDAAATLENRF